MGICHSKGCGLLAGKVGGFDKMGKIGRFARARCFGVGPKGVGKVGPPEEIFNMSGWHSLQR
jgi:hypothetical protein